MGEREVAIILEMEQLISLFKWREGEEDCCKNNGFRSVAVSQLFYSIYEENSVIFIVSYGSHRNLNKSIQS